MEIEEQIPEEETTNYLCCGKCNCTNIAAVKKGFSGVNAVIGYLIASAIGGFIICIDLGNPVDLLSLYMRYSLAAVLCLLSFFAGTINMNDIYSICLRCGSKILINKASKKEPDPETQGERFRWI